MSAIFAPDAQRGDLQRLIRTLNIDTNQVLVQPFMMRFEKEAKADRSNYRFDILSNPGSDREQEIKLGRNDAFGVLGLRLGVRKQDESVTPKQYTGPVVYSADPNYFSGAPAGQVKEFISLQPVFDGKLTIKTQNTDRVRDLSTALLVNRPNRGYITTASSSQTNAEFPEQTVGQDGFFRLMPNPILSGQDNNFIDLVLGSGDFESIEGTADSAGTAVATRNVIVVELFGYLLVDYAKPALMWKNF